MTTTPATLSYLSVDHLGTPIWETNASGTSVWLGGFEPFGKDWSGAQTAGQFLRFPGQWDDAAWAGSGMNYNVNRWLDRDTGRYSMPDPLGLRGGSHLYSYVASNPLAAIDPLGLEVEHWCVPVGMGGEGPKRVAGQSGYKHCFVRVKCDCTKEGGPYDHRLEVTGRNEDTGMATIPVGPPTYYPDPNATLVTFEPPDWNSQDCSTENYILKKYLELQQRGYKYPGYGFAFGPNSNTFASDLLSGCGITTIHWPNKVTPFNKF